MLPDRVFSTFQTAGRGLAVQREKIAVASRNIANAGVSAPKGSEEMYRPQTVQTKAVHQDEFKNLLMNSISSLKTSNEKHFSSPAPVRSSFQSAGNGNGGGIGPEPILSAKKDNDGQ